MDDCKYAPLRHDVCIISHDNLPPPVVQYISTYVSFQGEKMFPKKAYMIFKASHFRRAENWSEGN